MSYTSIWAIYKSPNDWYQEVKHFKNAYGGCIFIWDALVDRYKDVLPKTSKYDNPLDYKGYGRLWEYEETGGKMEPWERNVLRSTYDHAVLAERRFAVMADCMDRFKEEYGEYGEYVCSLGEQAECLRSLVGKALYVSWNQTSVNDFWGYGYDEELDIEIPSQIEPYHIEIVYM